IKLKDYACLSYCFTRRFLLKFSLLTCDANEDFSFCLKYLFLPLMFDTYLDMCYGQMKAVDARSGGTATNKLRLPRTRSWDDKIK
ncbi:hypothetical protein J1N35_041400, partial [Gossypium stocksii]